MVELTTDELNTIKFQTEDIHQAIMDIAYDKWQKHNRKVEEELQNIPEEQRREYYKKNAWDMQDWLLTLSKREQEAVALGKLNQQVCNGGWAQWVSNNYAADTMIYLKPALKNLPQTKEIKLIRKIVDNVETICEQNEWGEGTYEEQVENDCEECGGCGEDDNGECQYCNGDGYVTDYENIRYEDTLHEDIYSHKNWNNQFFEVSDKFLEICHDYFRHKILGTELTFKDYTEAEDIKVEKIKPKVKLVGRDGNAFYIMGAVRQALAQAKYSRDEIDNVMKEMQSGDYNNLLRVAMKYCEVS